MNGRWANEWSFVDAPGEGCLRPGTCSGEPVLVTEDAGRLRVLSNVCTHRGALLVTEPSDARSIHVDVYAASFQRTASTRHARSLLSGASITNVPPPGRSTSACVTSGAATT